ncbi:hypothetical protein F2P56_009732 [Juglans regia]|uniref:CASP-like protein n=2 Tax=Juglans regia TaxID=51240 RepID=A0A2I4GWQ9_JUGRE|nr:CASP-like protein 1C2 [Juglans regia]KAF5473090.1 hypothetical protein F2P56_009732 [Juglans regia]
MITKTWKMIFTLLLRLLALTATLAATLVMVTAHDSTEVMHFTFKAKYSYEPAFKYFVVAEAIASGYSLIVLFLSSKNSFSRLVMILDMVVAMLLISSVSAAMAVAYVGKKGNIHAGWLPICGEVAKFCNQATGALISGLLAAIMYLLLLIYSLHDTAYWMS